MLLPPPKPNGKGTLPSATRSALGVAKSPSVGAAEDPLNNPELCMRPGDLPAKEGDVFAIKKFKPDKEGDQQTYSGISQSGAREIMVGYDRGGTDPSSIVNCITAT